VLESVRRSSRVVEEILRTRYPEARKTATFVSSLYDSYYLFVARQTFLKQ